MKSYHYAWLKNHPDWDEETLAQALAHGFDVHHIDGDHENDEPDNLILIEHGDHMRLHDTSMRRPKEYQRERTVERWITKGQQAYELKAPDPSCFRWDDINEILGIGSSLQYAKYWARKNNLPWPLGSNGMKSSRFHSDRRLPASYDEALKELESRAGSAKNPGGQGDE